MGTRHGVCPGRAYVSSVFSGNNSATSRLRGTLLGCDRLRVRIERHANCRMTQQFLHDLKFGASRSKKCGIGMAKGVPADSFRNAYFSRNRKDMVAHDLLRQVGPPALIHWTREHPTL